VELPRFTPTTRALPTLFNASREGAELLFLLIIPAVSVIFTAIGILDFIGVWESIKAGVSAFFNFIYIDPNAGLLITFVAPPLGLAELMETAASIDPRYVIGTVVLAFSGLPFSVVFGQIPAIWATTSDLNEREAMGAAVLGIVMRIVTVIIVV